jgi:uncharacterized membrane protein
MIDPADQVTIETRVGELESAFGVEVVTIVVGKSDVYPETVWKAFALGAALTGLVVAVHDLLRPAWTSTGSALWPAVAMLGIGALWALGAVFVPAFARLFLRTSRANIEVAQFADVQFLQRELFATPARNAVLILASRMEQRVVIRADTGLRDKVTVAEWDAVIARMIPALRAGTPGTAMLAGLAALRELFAAKGFTPTPHDNRLANRPIEAREP